MVDAAVCHYALAVMMTAGLYETSGDWLYDIGLPGKSGIGGGIVAVSPGKGGFGTFAPPLDAAGNSVQGTAARQNSCRSGWGWICSYRNRNTEGAMQRAAARPWLDRSATPIKREDAWRRNHVDRRHPREARRHGCR